MQILKSEPRDRSTFGISGKIKASIKVCSKEEDGIDSWIYIGTGGVNIALKEIRIEGDVNRLVRDLSKKIVRDVSGFVRVGGKPTIPGSSVKGNIRSRLELSFIPKDGKIRSCFIRSSPLTRREPKKGEHGWRHYKIWKSSLQFDRKPCDYNRDRKVCLICDLFGTTGLQGLISFSDFVGEFETKIFKLPYESIEAAPPGSRFTGEITFINLKLEEIGLLLFGMGLRDSKVGKPVLLGKYKYRIPEFGVVRYEVEKIEFLRPIPELKGSTDEIVQELVNRALKTFKGELIDVDEVRELEKLED